MDICLRVRILFRWVLYLAHRKRVGEQRALWSLQWGRYRDAVMRRRNANDPLVVWYRKALKKARRRR
jgi:hypothetical protein